MSVFLRLFRRKSCGFTIPEILIASMIVTTIGASVYATFSQSLKLWSRATGQQPDLTAEILFEKLSDDLRNAYVLSGQGIKGWEDSVEFPGYERRQTQWDEGISLPVQVRYVFDPNRKELQRGTLDWREMLYRKTKTQVSLRKVAGGILSCRFEYYAVDSDKKRASWKSFWQESGYPKAVRISLSFDENHKIKHMKCVIPIPAGGG